MAVTYQPAGLYDTGTASCVPAFPASPAAGDLLLLLVGIGNGDDTAPTVGSGFLEVPSSSQFGGTGSYGTDTGNRGVKAFYKIADGTETGTVTVTNPGSGTTTRVTQAQMLRFTKSGAAFNVKATTGTDNTSGTGYSVTGATAPIPASGDYGITLTCWIPDTGTAGTPTLTWDGAATSCTQVNSIASTQGADARLVIYRRSMAGTGGSAPIFATTASANVVGPTAFILIHDGPAVTGQTVSSFGFTATTAGVDRALGAAAAAFGFASTASGDVTAGAATGQVSAAFGFDSTASGIDRALGQTLAAFGFTAATAGVDRALGQVAASFGFTASTNGIDRALGLAVATFGFEANTAGIDRALGVSVSTFGFTATAAGVVGSSPVTGSTVAAFGFTAQTAGIDRALGSTVSAFGFTGTAAGIDRALGVTVASFGFATTTAGLARVLGLAAATFGFTAQGAGIAGVPRDVDFTVTIAGARYTVTIAPPAYAAGVTSARYAATVAPARYSARIEDA